MPTAGPSFVVYEWLSPRNFVVHAVAPEATVISCSIDDDPESVLRRLPPAASAFLFHQNCTKTRLFPRMRDGLIDALSKRGIQLLNARVTDISKRTIQNVCLRLGLNSTLATPEGPGDETVIVKTDLNFGGDSEWALTEEERQFLGLGKGSDIIWNPNHYRIIPRNEVLPIWWQDESLVCERYVCNREDRWYRAFLFLNRVVLCEFTNPSRIKKVGDSRLQRLWRLSVENGEIVGHPDSEHPRAMVSDLAKFIRAFELEFGTVDILEDDSASDFIIDVNTTPAYGHPIPGLAEHLRSAFRNRA